MNILLKSFSGKNPNAPVFFDLIIIRNEYIGRGAWGASQKRININTKNYPDKKRGKILEDITCMAFLDRINPVPIDSLKKKCTSLAKSLCLLRLKVRYKIGERSLALIF